MEAIVASRPAGLLRAAYDSKGNQEFGRFRYMEQLFQADNRAQSLGSSSFTLLMAEVSLGVAWKIWISQYFGIPSLDGRA